MSDRVQTAIKWLQWIAQAIGVLLAILGGTQAADIAPAAFGGGDATAASGNTLAGVALMFLTPAVGWVVRTVYAKTRGKQFTPAADLIASETSVTQLELYLQEELPAIRQKIADTYSKASKAAKPVLTVDVK